MRANEPEPAAAALTARQAPVECLSLANWQQAAWNRRSPQNVGQITQTVLISRCDAPVGDLPTDAGGLWSATFESSGGNVTLVSIREASFTDAFIVLRRGRIVAERYFHGMRRDTRHLLLSVAKSMTGMPAGRRSPAATQGRVSRPGSERLTLFTL